MVTNSFKTNSKRFLLVAIIAAIFSSHAFAQGGPENVLLVVNSKSESSKLIANHYIQLRKIPASHVLYLDNVKYQERENEKNLKATVIEPILKAIETRGLSNCIDYIVYSSDFPTSIKVQESRTRLLDEARRLGKTVSPQAEKVYSQWASLTSLTYYARQLVANDPLFILLDSNYYMRSRPSHHLESRSFHSSDIWKKDGELTPNRNEGRSYYISTILSITRNYGLNEEEALWVLNNSVKSDGHPPEGYVYFCTNKDPRTAPRIPFFKDTIAELKKLNIKTRVIKEKLPRNAKIAGLVSGFAEADLMASENIFSAGCICDNLTSIGGMFIADVQLKCTEFLRFGAAGANGCVDEPFAIALKFPHPMIQVHYARGCTLGEAYYQSIYGPYQNLIVGDPLCRPYGTMPQFEVNGLQPNQKVSGTLELVVKGTNDVATSKIHVYIDGVRVMETANTGQLSIDTTQYSDGFHELRVVGIVDGLIEFNSRQIIPLVVDNQQQEVTITCPANSFDQDDKITISVDSNVDGIELVHHGRVLGKADLAGKHQFEVDAKVLGRGPVILQAFGNSGEGKKRVGSSPLELEIKGAISTTIPQPNIPQRKKLPGQ